MRPQLAEDDIAQIMSINERLSRLEQAQTLREMVRAAVFVGPWSGTASSDKTITGLLPGDYLVGAQASAYRTTAGLGGTDFYLNGVLRILSYVFFNEPNSHRAANTSWTLMSITGTTLLVQLRNGAPGGVLTSSDGNDFGSVVVIPSRIGAVI